MYIASSPHEQLERERARAYASRQRSTPQPAGELRVSRWHADRGEYWNRDRGKPYAPHHADEARFVFSDGPRYALAKGGEGGGKSVAGIVKVLERLRRGMNGIMGSPDLEHFKRSLWPEFARWCPWDQVIARHQYRGLVGWEPQRPFALAFKNGAVLFCGGFDDPASWEGPNVSFAHIDEARRKKDATVIKVLDGRIRIPGPNGEPSQLFITTTPAMNWLYDYFGPIQEEGGEPDPHLSFKRDSMVIDLLTIGNADNLEEGYAAKRRSSLTEAEARVLLEAAWEDLDTQEHFLESMMLWDACREALPPLTRSTSLVLAADAGISSDTFALVGVSRHPTRRADVAVRYARAWVPSKMKKNDFDEIEAEIRRLSKEYSVVQVPYDPMQLHQMMTRLVNEGVCWADEFNQWTERLIADKQLHDLITQRRLAHDGNEDLRQHIKNADRRTEDPDKTRADNKLFIVKRQADLKIDLAVALSMAAKRCLDLNL
jgi:hypothetical protein